MRRWVFLIRPKIILALLILLVGLWFFLSSLSGRRLSLVAVPDTLRPLEPRTEMIELVTRNDSRVLELSLPAERSERLAVILNALRDEAAGLWPSGLSSPSVFLLDDQVVLDFITLQPLALSAADEWQLYESIKATLERQNIKTFKVLINGQTRSTFLGHIAIDEELDE